MGDARPHVALLQLGKIEPSGEVLPFGGEQHGGDLVGHRAEESVETEHGIVVERVTLVRALEPQNRYAAIKLGSEGWRKGR